MSAQYGCVYHEPDVSLCREQSCLPWPIRITVAYLICSRVQVTQRNKQQVVLDNI